MESDSTLQETYMTYGCHNRPPLKSVVAVQDGWVHDFMSGATKRTGVLVSSPFLMAPDCQYTKTALGQADPKCEGCKHRLDI